MSHIHVALSLEPVTVGEDAMTAMVCVTLNGDATNVISFTLATTTTGRCTQFCCMFPNTV